MVVVSDDSGHSPRDAPTVVGASSGVGPEAGPGDRVGRYLISHRIGRGGMGQVMAAWDPELDRVVALKLLLNRGPDAADRRVRVLREAQALARLSHPNVVPVYDVGGSGDWLFIAMEYVRGPNLAGWLAAERRDVEEIVEVMRQAGRGLAAAHAAGLVHRDFKPGNVVIDADAGQRAGTVGRARVLDFGLARLGGVRSDWAATDGGSGPAGTLDEALTAEGTVLGTPVYMAPEQHRGKTADARSDQYAFCVSLYEAIVGQRPFSGPMAALAKRKAKGPPPIIERPDVPAHLWAAIRRGLHPDPAKRFFDMPALLDALAPPRRRRPSGLAMMAVGATALGLAWAVAPASEPTCEQRAAKVAQVWNQARADELHAALLGTQLPYVERTWSSMNAALDAFASRWSAAYVSACTDAVGRQRDRTMTCLGGELEMADAMLRMLEREPNARAESAVRVVTALPDPKRCAEPSFEPSSRFAQRLADARALGAAGDYVRQHDVARRIQADAEASGDRSAWVEATWMVGTSLLERGEQDAGAGQLEAAVWAAKEIGRDDVAARAASSMVSVACDRHALEDADTWLRHAEASAARVGSDPELPIVLLHRRARLLGLRGDYEGALAYSEQALELVRQLWGDDDLRVASALEHVAPHEQALGRLERAAQMLQEVVSIYERRLGPEHPEVADALVNLGGALYAQRRFDDALAVLRRAIEVLERSRGTDHPTIDMVRSNLGLLLLEAGKTDEALQVTRRALQDTRRRLGPDHPEVAKTLTNLGNIQRRRGDPEAAVAAYQGALAAWEGASGPDFPQLAYPLTALGDTLLALDRPAEAIEPLRRALSLLDASTGIELQPAAQALLAQALWRADADRQEALTLAAQAHAGLVRAGPVAQEDLAALERWYAEIGHTPPSGD